MSILRSERFMYFQNKANHYYNLEKIKAAVDSSPPKKRSPHHFRPRTLMQEKNIQQQNQHLIDRLFNIEFSRRSQIQVDGTYSRFHKVDRPFRSINPKRREQLRSVTIDTDQMKGRLQRAKAAVGSQKQWEREYSRSVCAKNNLRKYGQTDKSRGNLVISTDRYMLQHLRDYALGHDIDKSLSGKKTSLSRQKLFALPKIEKQSRKELTFDEFEKKNNVKSDN